MWFEFLRFDLRYLLRQPMVWFALVLFTGLAFASYAMPPLYLRAAGASTLGAPINMGLVLAAMTLLGTLVLAGIFAGSVLRDFESKAANTLFSYAVTPRDYVLGRLGAALACCVGLFAVAGLALVSVAVVAAPVQQSAWQVIVNGGLMFVLVVVPNVAFAGTFAVAVACRSRSASTVFGAVFGLYVLWALSAFQLVGLDADLRAWIGGLTDPFGSRALFFVVEGHSVVELDQHLPLNSTAGYIFLLNRALWLALCVAISLWTAKRFQPAKFQKQPVARKRAKADTPPTLRVYSSLAAPVFSWLTGVRQAMQLVKFEVISMLHGRVLRVLFGLGVILLAASIFQMNGAYGSRSLLTTAWLIGALRDSVQLPLTVLAIVLATELLTKDHDSHSIGVMDALPVLPALRWFAQVIALVLLLDLYVAAVGAAAWVCQQMSASAPAFDSVPWLTWFKTQSLQAVLFAALALAVQKMSQNRFVGYGLFFAYLVAGKLVLVFSPEHSSWVFGQAPLAVYSDLNGYGQSMDEWLHAAIGWVAVALVAVVAAYGVCQSHGTQQPRLRRAGTAALAGSCFVVAYSVVASANAPDPADTASSLKSARARYEQAYKQFENKPQLRVVGVSTNVDIYPAQHQAAVRGHYQLVNSTDRPVTELLMTLNRRVTTTLSGLPDHKVVVDDAVTGLRVIALKEPVQPGAALQLDFEVRIASARFDSEERISIVDNGTAFNNHEALPQLGYLARNELKDPEDRARYGLAPRSALPSPEEGSRDSQLEGQADWVSFEAVVSTERGQTAFAPGDLMKKWDQGERSYFQYKMQGPMLPYFAYVSGRYQLKTVRSQRVQIEAYYDPLHEANVDKLLEFARDAVTYYERQLGPYHSRTLKLVEFPNPMNAAQGYPGLILFSDSSELTHDLDSVQPNPLRFLVAHEVGHQWWGNQLIGAKAAGASLLTETLAQYGALQQVKAREGAKAYEQAVQFDAARYRSGKQSDTAEPPLLRVTDESYIAYHKGVLVFDKLVQLLGPTKLNQNLRTFFEQYRFSANGYPTSVQLETALCKGTTPQQCGRIKSLLEKPGDLF
jgi:ABC-2 type transport system permease protein